MNPKEQIETLLQRLDLTLHYVEVFDRWVLDLKDADGNTVWHRRGIDLVEMRDELIEFLVRFETKNEERRRAKAEPPLTEKRKTKNDNEER